MIQFTDDLIVKRLRWVMLFSMIATLAGQPQEFWTFPERAIRFDGLSIYDHTNHKFEFFLGHGWEAYVLACAVYFAAAFTLVSVLPRRPALIAMFSEQTRLLTSTVGICTLARVPLRDYNSPAIPASKG